MDVEQDIMGKNEMTVMEVVQFLQVSTRSVYERLLSGRLKGRKVKVGKKGTWRIPREAVENWAEARKLRAQIAKL